jgi:membrane protein implicated in regulation of membrane protease activity
VKIELWWIWMLLAAILLVLERVRAKSFCLWLSIGAASSGILALLAVPAAGQVVVFIDISGILILLEKRFYERYTWKQSKDIAATDTNRLPGTIAEEEKPNIFRKKGDVWEIQYAGISFIEKHSIGLVHIRNLIMNSGNWIHCSELKRISSINREQAKFAPYRKMSKETLDLENLRTGASMPPEKLVDALTLEQIRALQDVLKERKASDDFSSPEERLDQLETLDFLEKYLISVTDKKGRPRTILDQEDTDRKAISIAINRSRNNLKNHMELYVHFKSFIQAEGNSFRYLPDRPIDWNTN